MRDLGRNRFLDWGVEAKGALSGVVALWDNRVLKLIDADHFHSLPWIVRKKRPSRLS